MKRGLFASLASLAAIAMFAGVNLAAWKWLAPARLDFTGNGLYTLSDSAKVVVDRLVEPVELQFVYSRGIGTNFPAVRAHADRVRELMHEIAARANGKVRITEIDPEPFSEDEDRISSAGLTPAPTEGGDPLYLGVIGRNSVDDVIAIPYLAPERDANLEYDLVRLIAQLDDPAPPKVAVISSLPAYQGDGRGQGDAFVLKEMRRAFDVVPVDPDFRSLPAGTDVLMLVHPAPMSDWQQYLIDQFLLRKGRALIAVDPVSRVALALQGRHAIPSSSLGKLEASLGVHVGAEAVADRAMALPVETDMGGGRKVVEGQPLFIAVPKALMGPSDAVTSDLSRAVNFGIAGAIRAQPTPGVIVTTLAETTNGAALVPGDIASEAPAPRQVIAAMKPAGGPIVVAARVAGDLKSAFAAPPQADLPEDPTLADLARQEIASAPPYIAKSETPAQVVLVADSDAFDDSFYINPNTAAPVADNAAFILNALDNLGGDEALMALRSRSPAARPMERVDALRASARERLYQQQSSLEKRLTETQARLDRLQAARPAGAPARTAEETAEIDAFRAESAQIRQRLRGVEREFRRDIDRLARQLELVNVWLPPLVVAALGLLLFAVRGRRRSRT
jgi:ABC-type uncharacterized transport system involved in gliding motility auxiliary subunit